MMNKNILSMLSFSFFRSLPMIRQTEVSECGLACLAMVAGYWGYSTNIIAMRKKFPVSSRGMNLQNIVDLADSLELSSTAVRLELEELGDLQMPCILHWDLNHYVVLKSVSANEVVIHDPAVGIRRLSFETVSKSFTGVALQLAPKASFQKKEDKPSLSLREFWKSLKGIQKSLGLLFGISLVVQLLGLISPLFTRFIIDDVIVYKDYDFLVVLCIGFALMNMFTTACGVIRSLFLLYLSKTMSMQVSSSLFSHLIRLPMNFFIKRHTGDIISRFGSLASVQKLVTTTFVESTLDGILAICTLSMMMLYSIPLALITMVALVLYITIRALTITKLREMSEEALNADSQERTAFLETLHSMQPIKVFHKEQDRQHIWQSKLASSFNVQIRNEQMMLSYNIIHKIIYAIENIAVLYGCAQLIMADNALFSVGMMYAYLQYKSQFIGSVTSLVDNFFQFKMISLHLERISDIALHDKDNTFKEDLVGKKSPDITGQIELQGLTYKYDEFEPNVFEGLNLTISAGQSVALVGPSGCGKTTLMKVLLGLLDANDGKVLIDGISLQERCPKHYRTSVASVMQNDTLLSGSILENISFFDSEVDENRVHECAKIADIHNDIMKMPMGYQTLCGELGTQISGGQMQRILIARALYIKPKILFLDEATSHLDLMSEKRVSQAIASLKITRVIIAHRPETIQTCDKVVLVHKDKCTDITDSFKRPSAPVHTAKTSKAENIEPEVTEIS